MFKDIPPLACIGFSFVFVQQKLYLEDAYMTTAGNNAIICAAIPIITILINGLLKYEVITVKKVVGTMVSIVGVAVVIFYRGGEIEFNGTIKGDIIVFVSIILWSAYIIVKRRYTCRRLVDNIRRTLFT